MAATVTADYVDNNVIVEVSPRTEFEVWEYAGEETSIVDVKWFLEEIGVKVEYSDILYWRDLGFGFPMNYTIPAGGIEVTCKDENISVGKSYVMFGVHWEMINAETNEYEMHVQRMFPDVSAGKISGIVTMQGLGEIYYVEVKGEVSDVPEFGWLESDSTSYWYENGITDREPIRIQKVY